MSQPIKVVLLFVVDVVVFVVITVDMAFDAVVVVKNPTLTPFYALRCN